MTETADRAWTPGPWRANRKGRAVLIYGQGTTCVLRCMEELDTYQLAPADAQLIALAPEMAEAILAWLDNDDGVTIDALEVVGDRLRAIGGEAAS